MIFCKHFERYAHAPDQKLVALSRYDAHNQRTIIKADRVVNDRAKETF
jgi:hypothetical protein